MSDVRTISDVSTKDKALVLYQLKDIMTDHALTLQQAMYLLCTIYDIQFDISMTDENALFNKSLLKGKRQVNQTLLFHLKAAKQLSLDMNFNTEPNGDDYTLDIADRIEKEFTNTEFLTDEFRKTTADKYFKGDLIIARYFLIFRSLFPVKDKQRNAKWNTKFGFIYDGYSLWDNSPTVTKKFTEVYRKKDIGMFLETTYKQVKDVTNVEEERSFMTKPYKFLTSYDDLYDDVVKDVAKRQAKKSKIVKSNLDI